VKSSRVIVIVLVAIACSLVLAAPALATTSLNSYEKQLLGLINKQRARHGLTQLRINDKLVDSARAHSADMGEQKYFSHDSSDGETWSSRIVRYGYKREGCSYWRAGENIYWGAGLSSSPYLVMGAWMKSSAHRAVILTRAFREIGVGAIKTDSGYGSVDGSVWFFTLDLGRRVQR
jgi:uncharacterized protein YkwD